MFLSWKNWLTCVIYQHSKFFDFYRSRAGFWKGKKCVVCGFFFVCVGCGVGVLFKCWFRCHFGRIEAAKLRKKIYSVCWSPVENSCRIKREVEESPSFCIHVYGHTHTFLSASFSTNLLCWSFVNGCCILWNGCSKYTCLPCRTSPAGWLDALPFLQQKICFTLHKGSQEVS